MSQSEPKKHQHPAYQRFQNSIAEYEAYLPLTQRVQEDLRNDAEELRAQEGWNEDEWIGIEEWVNDMDSIFRHLRRHRFDETKTMTALLTTLQQRITLSSHLPIPSFPPYTDSPLFFILPLPDHTDRLGRPIAVLSVKEVIRDTDGKLDDLKSYAWWALEMVRRVLRDCWIKGNWSSSRGESSSSPSLGKGGEGLCLVVDASGAGYRNMEVELLPTLLSVGHNNFPGMIESVYVVNTGWTHRSMWNVIKRVLPKSASEKVAFLDNKSDLESVFDLDKLPLLYGGNHPYTFSPTHNPIYTYYSHHSSTDHPFLASRNSSYSSIADIYYSAPNTPARSRRNSSAVNLGGWRLGPSLRMTKSREASTPPMSSNLTDQPEEEGATIPRVEVAEPTPLDDDPSQTTNIPTKPSISRRSSSSSTPLINGKGNNGRKTPTNNSQSQSQSAIQRIKSLSDFHLYLSPSRLAHLDLLSDSDSNPDSDSEVNEHPQTATRTKAIPRKILKPALFENDNDDDNKSLSARRSRPPLRLSGVKGQEGLQNVRSYSDRLQQHHAKVLKQYTAGGNTPSKLGQNVTSDNTPPENNTIQVDTPSEEESDEMNPNIPGGLEPPSLGEHYDQTTSNGHVFGNGVNHQIVHEYDISNNPWFGYPVIRVGGTGGKNYSIRPKYSRNRKRDLIKTLLFLFMLRLQSWRDSLERYLGLTALLNNDSYKRDERDGGGGPQEGLLASLSYSHNGSRELTRRNSNFEKDWWWMIIGFLLLRGTWSKLLIGPLETIGWGKEILGW